MKFFIKFVTLFLLCFSFFSNVFATTIDTGYYIKAYEKPKLNTIVEKLEDIISNKGESYRNLYISKLVDIKNEHNNEKITVYVDYIINKLNILSNLRENNIKCLINGTGTCTYIYECSASTQTVYPPEGGKLPPVDFFIPTQEVGTTKEIYKYNLDESNGVKYYAQTFRCDYNGKFIAVSYRSIVCLDGYYYQDLSCLKKEVFSDCPEHEEIVNIYTDNDIYSKNEHQMQISYKIPAQKSGEQTYSYSTYYKQLFYCNDGITSKVGDSIKLTN